MALIKLWTYQGPGLSLTSGTVDPSKSEFRNDPLNLPLAPAAYAELEAILNTDQFIWCCTKPEETWYGRKKYTLNVPTESVFAVVDMFVWNKILGKKGASPPSLRLQWKVDAIEQTDGNSEKMRVYIDERQTEYDRPENPAILWSKIFLKDASDERANVLLRHPIDRDWIVAEVCAGDAQADGYGSMNTFR